MATTAEITAHVAHMVNTYGGSAEDYAGMSVEGMLMLELGVEAAGANSGFRDMITRLAYPALVSYASRPGWDRACQAALDLEVMRRQQRGAGA